jgi:hypothetical protein
LSPPGVYIYVYSGGVTYTQNYDAENRLISVNVTGQALPTLFISAQAWVLPVL